MKLALIIPNYNKGVYIKDMLLSVFSQTYKNFDIFIRDDGSTDNSVEIINEAINFWVKDFTVSLDVDVANRGVCFTLNRLVEKIRDLGYTHFYIMGSDDTLKVNAIERLVNEYAPEYDFITSYAKLNGIAQGTRYSEQNLSLDSFRNGSPLLTTGIYSVKMWVELGGRREDWKLTHDYEFFIRMFINGYKHKVVHEELYIWNNYDGQLSRTVSSDMNLRRKAFEINGLQW